MVKTSQIIILLANAGMSNSIMNAARENILRSAESTVNQKSVITISLGVLNFSEKNNNCVAIFC